MLWLGNSKKHKSCLTNYNSKATLEWVGVGSFLKKMKWLLMCWEKMIFSVRDQSAAAIKQGHKAKGHKKSQYAAVLFDLLLLLPDPKTKPAR